MNNNLNNNQNLDNPLVVHNKNDASYYNSTENNQMNETLVIEDENTLKRHRFKKDKSKKNIKWIALLVIFVVLAGVFCALYFTGNITFGEKETTTQETTTEQTTTSLADAYKGTIVIKDTYIFVDGIEVEGIQGLQDSLRILEPSATAYVIINDGANSQFLNDEILPVLLDMGFYNEETDIKRKSTPNLTPSTTAPPVQEETSEEVTE